MKFIEHRRHSIRTMPSPHLNQQGIDLARKIGAIIGPFNLVVTSPVPRAFETAIAMGFAVDTTIKEFTALTSVVSQEIPWDAGFYRFARMAQNNGATTLWVQNLSKIMIKILQKIPENGSILIISHGGVVEGSTVGCLPNFDYSSWDKSVNYCEGVRLVFENDKFASAKFLKVG